MDFQSTDKIEDKNSKELGIYLKDKQGKISAGLIGETHGNWLMIEFLWVDKAQRGQHFGTPLF